ncbi:MAG TPA: hypothetical protein VJI96_04635 [Candidatus Andersenbacteria bacterium]|nr:hypothetical protein [Candidatus Andersenbacteria bacterium]
MNGMIRFLRQQTWGNIALLFVALGCLLTPAVQYPLSTTFPIGGDAAAHIGIVQHLISRPILTAQNIYHSWYPISYILFSINAINPFVYWPIAFSWWMTLGQVITGLAIGLLSFRLFGIRAAAIGIALWGMTPIALTSFFEDATMAQLWSLPWAILFFERLAARSRKGMILCFFLASFSHPITGLILLVTIIITAPQLWMSTSKLDAKERLLRKIYSYSAGVAILLALGIFATRYRIFLLSFNFESSKYLRELFIGSFFPWAITAIYGWYHIVLLHKKNIVLITTLASFFFVSLLIAANDRLGIGFWTNRLNAYVTICIIVPASIGFARMIDMLRPKGIALLFTGTLLASLTGSVVYDNRNIYKRNESSTISTRITHDELQAIAWMKENISLSANVVSSSATRHYEWLPVLAGLSRNDIASSPNTFLVFFTRTETVPEYIGEKPEQYHLEYINKGAAVFRIIPL